MVKIIILILLLIMVSAVNQGLAQTLADGPLTQAVTELNIENSLVMLEVEDPQLRLKADIIVPWLRYSALSVRNYYGKFPVRQYRLQLISIDGERVKSGHALMHPSSAI